MIFCLIVYVFFFGVFYQIGRATLIGNESAKSDKIINITTSILVAIAWPVLLILIIIRRFSPSVKVNKDASNIQFTWCVPQGGSGGSGKSLSGVGGAEQTT